MGTYSVKARILMVFVMIILDILLTICGLVLVFLFCYADGCPTPQHAGLISYGIIFSISSLLTSIGFGMTKQTNKLKFNLNLFIWLFIINIVVNITIVLLISLFNPAMFYKSLLANL